MRVWTRGGCHSHQSPGKACDAFDDAHAGIQDGQWSETKGGYSSREQWFHGIACGTRSLVGWLWRVFASARSLN